MAQLPRQDAVPEVPGWFGGLHPMGDATHAACVASRATPNSASRSWAPRCARKPGAVAPLQAQPRPAGPRAERPGSDRLLGPAATGDRHGRASPRGTLARAGVLVTTLTGATRAVVRISAQRGTAEQRITEGREATPFCMGDMPGWRARGSLSSVRAKRKWVHIGNPGQLVLCD